MKTSSAKAKGRRCAQEVKTTILRVCDSLLPDDIIITSSGETGEDLKFSPAARKILPISVECKNVEKLNIWKALEQASDNSSGFTPVLVFKRNRSETYACLPLEELVRLYESKNKS